jgi:amidase
VRRNEAGESLAINHLSASEMARQIAHGDLTSEAVVSACLARIEERDAAVQAWAYLDSDLALRQARFRDREPSRGPLHGVPIGVKDVIDTADMPTQMGSPIYRGHQPRADASCVALVRAAGAVVLGKTVTFEFAGMAPGATTNPLHPAHTPGGSSSGSGAAVADFMVPVAFGTQTGGSVLRPAAFCGVFGYKPTFGRFNRAGVKPAAESLDTIGLIARSIEDLQLVDAVLVGRKPASGGPLAAPVIGACRTHLWPMAQPETVAAFEDSATKLERAGANVRELTLPVIFAELTGARERISDYERARGLAHEWQHSREQISERLRRCMERGFTLAPEAYWSAQQLVQRCRLLLADVMHGIDALLVPCAPGEAPQGIDYGGDPKMQELWTLLGTPAMTLPTHRGPNGLPVGIQLVTRSGTEDTLFGTARWVWQVLH